MHMPHGFSLFQALCQWRTEKASGRRVGSGREKGEILAFSIVLTDREPGTGYTVSSELLQGNECAVFLNKNSVLVAK